MRKVDIENSIKLKKKEIEEAKLSINSKLEEENLQRLRNELQILNNELEDRESRREIKSKLGYSRIGLNNV